MCSFYLHIQFGADSEMVINLRGFKKTRINFPIGNWTFTTHIASLESYYMPTLNSGEKRIARLKKGFDDRTTIAANINSRGNMDAVPGGWYPAQLDIVRPLLGHSPVDGVRGSFWQFPGDNISYFLVNNFGGGYWDLREFKFNHSFIPTFSALGIKNPDRNWAENLQRNLVCSGETPFDSYYGTAENTQHTSFTEESVTWLLKELGDNTTPPIAQTPSFPIEENFLIGVSAPCLGINTTYSFMDICKVPSPATWNVTSNLQIITSTGYSITINGLLSGYATITATFQNGLAITKTISIGQPSAIFSNTSGSQTGSTFNYGYSGFGNFCCFTEEINLNNSLGVENGVLGAEYEVFNPVSNAYVPRENGSTVIVTSNDAYQIDDMVYINVRGRVLGDCDWSEWSDLTLTSYAEYFNLYTVYPNPSKDVINIELANKKNQPNNKSIINGELFDIMGQSKRKVQIKNNAASIIVSGLPKGIYVLNINIDGKIEGHQVIVE